MGFPKVKSFFGINLRTGTLIIAGLSLVGNIVCFFFFLYTLVMDLRFMEVKKKKIFCQIFWGKQVLTFLTRWSDTHRQ